MARPGLRQRRAAGHLRLRRDAVLGHEHAVGADDRHGGQHDGRDGPQLYAGPVAPTATATVTAISADSGTAGDYITNTASQTVSGTYTGTLGAGETIQVSAEAARPGSTQRGIGGTFTASGRDADRRAPARCRCDASTRRATRRPGPATATRWTTIGADGGCDGDGAERRHRQSASDFITNVASQTVSGTFTGTLGAGEKIQVSAERHDLGGRDGGIGDVVGESGVTLSSGTGTLSVRTIDTAGNTTAGTGHSYTLDQSAPAAAATVTAMSADSGSGGDFITNVASQTVSGTFTGTLGAGETIQVSADGTTWVDATPVGIDVVGSRA